MNALRGIQILESVWLTVSGEPIQVRRTWRARLFSWPWQPWRATYTVVPQVPNPSLYRLSDGSMVGHPATVAKLKAALIPAPPGAGGARPLQTDDPPAPAGA